MNKNLEMNRDETLDILKGIGIIPYCKVENVLFES